MVTTVYCDDPKCAAYKKNVKFTFVFLHGRACATCGKLMVDGERSNDDFKNGRKRVVGKRLIIRGRYQPTRFKKKRKSSATKQRAHKR
jgi:hypothetical protein